MLVKQMFRIDGSRFLLKLTAPPLTSPRTVDASAHCLGRDVKLAEIAVMKLETRVNL